MASSMCRLREVPQRAPLTRASSATESWSTCRHSPCPPQGVRSSSNSLELFRASCPQRLQLHLHCSAPAADLANPIGGMWPPVSRRAPLRPPAAEAVQLPVPHLFACRCRPPPSPQRPLRPAARPAAIPAPACGCCGLAVPGPSACAERHTHTQQTDTHRDTRKQAGRHARTHACTQACTHARKHITHTIRPGGKSSPRPEDTRLREHPRCLIILELECREYPSPRDT
jgi:hypothetical protein